MDKTLQGYITNLREVEAVINSATVAKGIFADRIVWWYNSGLLESNGGYIKCTKHCAKHLLS